MKKETPRTWPSGPATQGAAASRVWNAGPPPHVGWWNASIARQTRAWRWWDGIQWSKAAEDQEDAQQAREWALGLYPGSPHSILWTNYYPKNARVPRVDPNDEYVVHMLPALNAGSLYAWEEAGHRMNVRKYQALVRAQQQPLALDELRAASKPYAPLSMQLPEACSFGDGMVVAYDTSAKPTPEEDEAWRAISTGQPQNPGARDLAGVSTRDLMTELFRRVG